MNWIQLPGSEIEIRSTPITRAEFLQFVRETGRPALYPGKALSAPITGVSAGDAMAFAEHCSQHDSWHYRLPTLEEMHTLALQAWNDVNWPARQQDSINGAVQEYLDEWLGCSVDLSSQPDQLHCIMYPTWLLTSHRKVTSGALVDHGYSFVTFRLARGWSGCRPAASPRLPWKPARPRACR
jgi:formylglycine-generating enzyme required for sulfatase activity